MNKISLYKVIQNLQFMSHLWIVQKTELTKKPNFTSRKMLIFKKTAQSLPRKQDVLRLMLLYKLNN